MNSFLVMLAGVFALTAASICAAENKKIEPERFAVKDQLDVDQLKAYRLHRRQLIPGAEETEIDFKVWLAGLTARLQQDPPYTPDQVRQGEGRKPKADQDTIPGVFRESSTNVLFGKEWGPLLLRKSFDDWSKDASDVDGASISYENDRRGKSQTWSSEGALIYPLLLSSSTVASNQSSGMYLSQKWLTLPTIAWKLSDVSDSTNDVEDLTFHVSIGFTGNKRPFWNFNQWRDKLTISPYFQTDFHGHGRIVGGTINYEPLFQIGAFDVGQWHSIANSRIAYLLRVRPRVEYSNVLKGSRFIERPEDDRWFRGGSAIEGGIRPFGKDAAWELKASYTFLWEFEGGHDSYSDLFEAKTTYWFTKAEEAGLTFSFQKGETPVSDKDINLLKLGLEVKL